MTDDKAITEFSQRLNALCDEHGIPLRGRPEALRLLFKVSREAARKWLFGLGYPTTAKRGAICKHFNVTDSWLLSGRGNKHPTADSFSPHQIAAMTYMRSMSPEQQALAVRLLAQILETERPTSAHTTGTGAHPMALHEPTAH